MKFQHIVPSKIAFTTSDMVISKCFCFYNGDQDIVGPKRCGTGPYMKAATLIKFIEVYLIS